VALLLDKTKRGQATAAQVQAGMAAVRAWVAAHPDAAQAKQESDALWDEIDRRWPAASDLQDQYFALPQGSQARRGFLNAHPELKAVWDFKDQWRAGHPVYNKYYPGSGKSTTASAYTSGGDTWEWKEKLVKEQGWRALYGTPWWQKWPRHAPSPYRRRKYVPPSYGSSGEWEYRRKIYGGPFR